MPERGPRGKRNIDKCMRDDRGGKRNVDECMRDDRGEREKLLIKGQEMSKDGVGRREYDQLIGEDKEVGGGEY